MNWIASPENPAKVDVTAIWRLLLRPGVYAGIRDRPSRGPARCDAVAMSARPGRAMDGYPVPPATMTDLYELTMAAGYWKLGRLDEEAIFTLFFRHAPFDGGFTLAAGLEGVIAFIERYAFSPPELAHLEGLRRQRRPAAVRARVPRLPGPPAAGGGRRRHARRARWSSRTSRCCG